MSRNAPLVQAVISYTLQHGTRKDGVTQQQIAEHFKVNRTTIGRIINGTPGFMRSLRPIEAKGYWFDITQVRPDSPAVSSTPVVKRPTGNSGEANPLLAANPAVVKEQIERLAKTLLKLAKGEQLEQEKLPLVIRALRLTADYLETKNGTASNL